MDHSAPIEPENGDQVIDRLMEDFVDLHLLEQFHEKLKSLHLSICIREVDDFPHPRHLCFKYPFGKSSFKKHCKKCYCYVCEEIAPCNNWNKSAKNHCHATDDSVWKSEKKARKRISSVNITTMARHTLSVSFTYYPIDQAVLISGFSGGLISDSDGNWVTGFSMYILDPIGSIDSSVLPYIALLEGLDLAWSRGLRNLNVELGFQFHYEIWDDFKNDTTTGKYRFREGDTSPNSEARLWSMLSEVESCINREWFIDVKKSASIKDESGALALSFIGVFQPTKQVYNFPSHPLTSKIKQMAEFCKDKMDSYCDITVPPQELKGLFEDLRQYTQI